MTDHMIMNELMPPGWFSRVAIVLAADQNECASPNGKKRQNNTQATHRDKSRQARQKEPYSQQDKTYISVHENLLSPYLL